MTRKRKLWATSLPRIGGDRQRHESQAAAYRFVHEMSQFWRGGALRSQHLTVWVDERDGFGWRRYDEIDLAEFGAEMPGETEKP